MRLRLWSALLALAALPLTALASIAPGPEVLPFIPDDYSRALDTARERKLPIFVEAWAPW